MSVTKPPVPANRAGGSPNQSEIEIAVERALEGRVQKRDLHVVTKQIAQLVVAEQFSGPLPHPKHLREYDAILPGAADRILDMAEASLKQNIEANQKALEADIEDRRRGMRYGAGLFALLILCLAVLCPLRAARPSVWSIGDPSRPAHRIGSRSPKISSMSKVPVRP